MEKDIYKSIIEYNLCKRIMKNQIQIINELNIILKEQNGYKYNSKLKKIKKHFPACLLINYEEYVSFLNKEHSKNKTVSFSLSSKPIIEQISSILYTATRRYNTINIFNNEDDLFEYLHIKNIYNIPILTPLDLRYNLIKYESEQEIRNIYPYFFNTNNKPFYNVIYRIKTENPHFYVDSNNKTLCDTILICCNGKIFNIMFELDIFNPYYSYLTNTNYSNNLIQELYNNTNV